MFEHERFSGLPGGALAAELEAVDPFGLSDEDLAAYLQAAKRLEAWADSLLARGICVFAEARAVADQDNCDEDDAGRDDTSGSGGTRRRGAGSGPLPGLARPVRFGGEGTPLVDEFAADELAPILQVAPMTAGHLLGDVLDLWHRLPWVRTGLRDGSLSWAAARAIASGTRELSQEQLDKARVDERLYTSATRLTPGKLRGRIANVVAQADPESVDDKAKDKQKRLYVGFAGQPQAQTTSIFGELDPTGAQRLDAQISAVARLLRRLDTKTPWEALRARALTLLADPAALRQAQARAAALATDKGTDDGTDDGTHDGHETGDASDVPAAGTTDSDGDRIPRLSTTVVHLHIDTTTWESGDGLVEVEGYGWMPLWSLTGMLADSHVRVVEASTDLTHPDHPPGDRMCRDRAGPGCAADPGYEPRESTKDSVAGRDRSCRFPGCNRRARACQCDHTRPWPDGPTCACNLGSLCTRHHRLKTHTDWALRQPWPGVFVWRDPAGRYWLVDHTGTTRLEAAA